MVYTVLFFFSRVFFKSSKTTAAGQCQLMASSQCVRMKSLGNHPMKAKDGYGEKEMLHLARDKPRFLAAIGQKVMVPGMVIQVPSFQSF